MSEPKCFRVLILAMTYSTRLSFISQYYNSLNISFFSISFPSLSLLVFIDYENLYTIESITSFIISGFSIVLATRELSSIDRAFNITGKSSSSSQ